MRAILLGTALLLAGVMAGGWWLIHQTGDAGLPTELVPIPTQRLDSAEVDDALFALAQRVGTAAAYRAYVEGCAEHGCTHDREARERIAELEDDTATRGAEIRFQRQLLDWRAYVGAVGEDTPAAYQAYLAHCLERGCAFGLQAEQRLDALRSAEQIRSRRAELEQHAAAIDQAAFLYAEQVGTEAAYRAYLDACIVTGCRRRAQAEGHLEQFATRVSSVVDAPATVALRGGCIKADGASGGRRDGGDRSDQICVDTFRIGKREVTFAQYDRFALATARDLPDDEGWGRGDRPVINVSWWDATAYAAWLRERTGRRYRLPTGSEWEYAARAGKQAPRFWGDEPSMACAYANVHDEASLREHGGSSIHHDCVDGYAKTAPVGSFEPNAFGLYDMIGNVWEWTCSLYDSRNEGAEQVCAPASSPAFRLIRGGAWHSPPRRARVDSRSGLQPSSRYGALGFRVAED